VEGVFKCSEVFVVVSINLKKCVCLKFKVEGCVVGFFVGGC